MSHPGVAESPKTPEEVEEWNDLCRETGREEDLIEPGDTALEARARLAVQEYNLHKSGIKYREQGYSLPGGYIPAVKALEHLVIHDTVSREYRKRGK